MNDQHSVTRSFVADHLKTAHREHRSDALGCMICSAWTWARETRQLDDAAIRSMLENVAPVLDVTHIPSRSSHDETE